jgi:hypothetical protein
MVILTSAAVDFSVEYGMIDNMLLGDFEGLRFPMIGMDDKGKKGFVSLESAPMFNLRQPDSVVRITVK